MDSSITPLRPIVLKFNSLSIPLNGFLYRAERPRRPPVIWSLSIPLNGFLSFSQVSERVAKGIAFNSIEWILKRLLGVEQWGGYALFQFHWMDSVRIHNTSSGHVYDSSFNSIEWIHINIWSGYGEVNVVYLSIPLNGFPTNLITTTPPPR